MSDTEREQSQQAVQSTVATSEQQIEMKIDKEIEKLKYYLEQTDELIDENDLKEIETINKRTKAILDEIYNLVSTAQEMKVEHEKDTSRAMRQWKKDVREKYMPWVSEMNKLFDFLARRQEQITADENDRKREAKRIEQERDREVIRQQEREILEEKLQVEHKITEKKIEMEKAATATQAKLSKLKISPFNGTLADWVRFENMFVTQVDEKWDGFVMCTINKLPHVKSDLVRTDEDWEE